MTERVPKQMAEPMQTASELLSTVIRLHGPEKLKAIEARDRSVRRQALEDAAKAECQFCKEMGEPFLRELNAIGAPPESAIRSWVHGDPNFAGAPRCRAASIHDLITKLGPEVKA